MSRLFSWYLHQRLLGYALFTVGMAYGGFGAASTHILSNVTPSTEATTFTRISTHHQTRFVTVHVRGKVIRRHDHILVVRVPRVVFHTRTIPRRRIVVPTHVVRIREKHKPVIGPPVVAAVLGVAPSPVTVTVPVSVTVPVTVTGPTTTVTGPTTTVTLPQVTTTVTVTVPLLSSP
jgi:hypothetical protein